MHEPVSPIIADTTTFLTSMWCRPSRLPVIYVFGRKPIEVESCVNHVLDLVISKDTRPLSVIIRHDVAYSYQLGARKGHNIKVF